MAASGPRGALLGGYAILATALFAPALRNARTSWVGGCCDPEQSIWFLRWTPYAITHLDSPFYSHHINSPDGVNLMWNAAVQFPALVLAPVTWAFGPVAAYNIALTAAVALAAWLTALALHRFCDGWTGPALGGLLYGFSPYVLPQAIEHLNLAIALLPPLLLLALDEVVRGRRSAAWVGVGIGAALAAQLLTSEEMLATTLGTLLLLGAAVLVCRRSLLGAALPRLREAGVACLVTFAVLAALPLREQFLGPQRLSGKVQAPDVFVTDLLNLVVPTAQQLFAPPAATHLADHFNGFLHEDNGYLGFALIVLLAFAAGRMWHRVAVRVAALLGVVVTLLALGPHLHIGGEVTGIALPWSWVSHLPFAEDALPGRLMVFVFLCAAVVLAVFVDGVMRRGALRAAPTLLAAVAAVVLVAPHVPFPTTQATIPPLFADWSAARIPDGAVVLVAPFIRDGGEADPMLWQAVADDRFRMPQGYYYIPGPDGKPQYGALPSTLSDAMETIQEKGVVLKAVGPALRAMDADLRARDISAVVVGPMSNRGQMVAFFTGLFGRPPEEIGGTELWRNVDVQGVDLSAG